MSEWETFCDESYYSLWRVRRKNERGFNDGYHIHNGEEARALVELLNGHERERDAERSLSNQLAGALMVTRWDSYTICKEAIFAWKEARGE